MDLPKTEQGNQHVIVFQDLFTKFPMVFRAQDQKSIHTVCLLSVRLFGIPEALLSDHGANLLSHWSYLNTPHSSTGEKPLFLMFGIDCRSPTEAAFSPIPEPTPVSVDGYRQELVLSVSSARELAQRSTQKAQAQYKTQYDKKSMEPNYKIREWASGFSCSSRTQEESGRNRKLSRPWHGPYRIIERMDPNLVVAKIYFPSEGTICIHQTCVCKCPPHFPVGYYWYGGQHKGPGRPPRW